MGYRSRIALAGVLALAAAGRGHAATVAGPVISSYSVGISTGLLSWMASFNEDGIATNQSATYYAPTFNPAYGVYQGTVSTVTLSGYPFLANYTVEGGVSAIGDKIVAHETLNGEVDMLVNNVVTQTATFSVSLNPSCTDGTNGFATLVCSDQEKQTFFSEPFPVALPAGATVTFGEKLDETDVSCVVDYAAGGSDACLSGGASVTQITDLNDINDPQYIGAVVVTFDYIPEPASMSVLAIGFAGLAGARRMRRSPAPANR